MAKKIERKNENVVSAKVLAKLISANEDEIKELLLFYADTDADEVSYDQATRAIIGKNLEMGICDDNDEAKAVIVEKQLGFDNHAEIVRIKDDGIIVVKMRLKKFKQEFLTTLKKLTK